MRPDSIAPKSSGKPAYRLGARVLLPAMIEPYRPGPEEPQARALWVYAADPANIGLREPIMRVSVPYEKVEPGPIGALFGVVNEPIHEDLRALMDWSAEDVAAYDAHPLDLDDLAIALGSGLMPSTGDPRFAAQMTYATCLRIYAVFRKALGRNPTWGSWVADRIAAGEAPYLRIRPLAFNDMNAFYDPAKGTLEFGYFAAPQTPSAFVLPGGIVFTALSRDIVAHEVTHAFLDGMRAEFLRDTHLDVPAFHEAFADLVALFHHFSHRNQVEQALAQSQGEANADLLLDLGKQFGEAINGSIGGALRRALKRAERPDTPTEQLTHYEEDAPQEPHDRGSILVAAIFEAFLAVFKARTEKLRRVVRSTRHMSSADLSTEAIELLAEAASRIGQRFLNICIRAIDYCPPVDIRFGSFLRAMITADYDVVPDDVYGYRDALIKAFRRRNIEIRNVRDLSEDSLRWKGPQLKESYIAALEFGRLRFSDDGLSKPSRKELERRACALGDFVVADSERLAAFGLCEPKAPYGEIVIESIRHAHRIGADGLPRSELVAEITQQRRSRGNTFVGGATVLIGMDGVIRFIVRRRVDDLHRRRAETSYAGPAGAARLDFREIHGERPRTKRRKS